VTHARTSVLTCFAVIGDGQAPTAIANPAADVCLQQDVKEHDAEVGQANRAFFIYLLIIALMAAPAIRRRR
jgi:hypothetical protein